MLHHGKGFDYWGKKKPNNKFSQKWDEEMSSFLLEWVRAPLVTASVVPSGKSLARKMVEYIVPETGPVIELGPGTGVFTRAILRRGIDESQLTLVEINPKFSAKLEQRYPKAEMIRGGAEQLGTLPLRHRGQIGAAVSGLPVLSMPDEKVHSILQGAFAAMKTGGFFMQFTYGPHCPISNRVLASLGLAARRSGFALSNFPPAYVYYIAKEGQESQAL